MRGGLGCGATFGFLLDVAPRGRLVGHIVDGGAIVAADVRDVGVVHSETTTDELQCRVNLAPRGGEPPTSERALQGRSG